MTTKLPAGIRPGHDPDDIHYPDSDDEPLPDGRYQEPYYIDSVSTIRQHFRSRPDVEVSGNTFIYYERGNPNRFVAPDCHVTLDVSDEGFASMEARNTYLIWEIGKPPDFVMEIASPSTARYDITGKRDLYAQIGMGEYWRFDATGGDFYGEPLVGEYLSDGEYHRFEVAPDSEGRLCGYSPALNLYLCWESGRLRFYDPTAGAWLRNFAEEQAASEEAQAARDQAQAERDRARNDRDHARGERDRARNDRDQAEAARDQAQAARDEEYAARLAAETRVAELEAELRRLRAEST